MHLRAEGIKEVLGTDVSLVAGEHQKIRLSHVGMIVGSFVVGDAQNGVAMVFVGGLHFFWGQLTVRQGAVAVQVGFELLFVRVDQIHENTSSS